MKIFKKLFQYIFKLSPMILGAGLVFFLVNKSFGQTQIIPSTTPGPGTFTVPAGVTSITVEVWGAGGRGGSRTENGAGGGGGGGAYSRSVLSVTPGQLISYYVGFRALTDQPGEDSWFSSNTTVMAKGGNSVALNSASLATGGAATDGFGDFRRSGGSGANASSGNGGGGGSSAGITANGNNATNQNGAGAPTGGGNGGAGKLGGSGQNGQGRGEDGSSPGGGGGGGVRSNASGTEIVGGYGGNGQIRISYIALTSATGTDNQSVCNGDPIINTTYSIPIPFSSVSPNLVISNLPAGLTSNYNSSTNTITISGTPTTSGTYTISTRPTYLSAVPVTLTRSGSVTVNPKPAVNPMIKTVCSAEAFTVSPVNGTNGVVPAGTTYSWSGPTVTGGITGGAAGSGAGSISGTLTNPTNTSQTATYTVTPTTGSCVGPPFNVTVTVDPTPTITDMTASVCTDAAFNLTPANGSNGVVPAGTTYSWSAPTVTGGMTGGAAGSGANTIPGTLTNLTNSPQTATYTVTPLAGGCTGTPFTVNVTVNPEPAVTDMTALVCTDAAFNVTPANGTNGVVPTGTTYTWSAPTVTGSMTGGVAGSGVSITGILSNTTNTAQTATYTVTPTSGTCTGDTFLLIVTVNPKPVVTNITTRVCRGSAFSITPENGTNGVIPIGTTFSWSTPVVTGGITGGTAGTGASSISGTFINPTNISQTATYTVTPTIGSCAGSPFTVAVTVDPTPSISDMIASVCTDAAFSFTPANGTNGIVPAGTTYSWSAPTVTGGMTGGAAGSGANTITGTLTNPTNSPQTATYTVTPLAGGCIGNPFTVNVTVNPEPAVTDMNTSVCTDAAFTVTPANGTNGVVPAGTTYTWSAPTVTGNMTGGAAGSGSSIMGTLSNTTNTAQTAIYTVTASSGTCTGNSFSLTVTITPKPDVNDMNTEVCSGSGFTLTPANGTNGVVPAGTTYSWSAPTVTGGITGGAAGSGASSISGTLTNPTNTAQTATYTVTPSTGGCTGDPFEITVMVDPTPTITDMTALVCTDAVFNLIPASGTNGVVPAGTTYSWSAPTVTGGMTGGAAGSGANSITGTLTNPTNSPQTATYAVTPTSGTCVGPDFELVITVDPITDITIHPSNAGDVECFGDGFDPISVTAIGGGLTYQWYSKTDNSDPVTNPGTPISGATSASFTPPSTTPEFESYYYYVVVTGNCGSEVSSLSGEYIVTPSATTITQQPSSSEVSVCKDESFPELAIAAIGETDLTFPNVVYQWYSNTSPTNTGGTLIPGATSHNFTPPSNIVGTIYYYATAASKCGTVPTNVTGAHTVTPFTAITEENLAEQIICDGDTFAPISIDAIGTGTLEYQWYSNTTNSTIGPNVTAVGTDSNSFTPPADAIGTLYYFVTVSSDCGPDQTSSVSGAFTVNPIPTITNTDLTQTICSGESTTQVDLTSAVAGTTYTWTATATAGVSGFLANGTGPIPTQAISTTNTSQGSVTYVITPSTSGCTGPSLNYTVLIDPLPNVTNASLTQTICSGESTTLVNLTSDVAGATFTWTATATVGVTGFTSIGTGSIPAQTITTSESSSGTVTYEITPTANTCDGPIAIYSVVVNPIPTVTNTDLDQTICSGGNTTQVDFTSAVAGTIFNWTASATPGVSGFAVSGTGPIPVQTISTTSTIQGTVTYVITPTANGCPGPPTNYTVLVDPLPTVTNTTLTQTICSGESTSQIDFTSYVAGTTFTWTTSATPGVSGFTTSGSGPIPIETISTTGTTQGTVTYVITPTANGCQGVPTNYTVLVDPLPTVTNASLSQTICSGESTTLVNLTSGVSGTIFNWTASATAGVTGFTPSGTGQIPVQTISTTGTTQGTVTYVITPSANGCLGPTTNYTVLVNPLATIGPTSVPFPSVCISSPVLTQFTQATSGVTSIGSPTGLPPGITALFNSSTGEITFSGTATTPGLYSYSIPLNGNCINGLSATGTIDVTPNYELTSVSSVSATVAGGTASITIAGNLPTLPNGTYEVTYILDDDINPPAEYTSSSFSVGNGRGTFASIPLDIDNVDVYKLTIKSIKKTTDVCTVDLDINDSDNTTYFSVCGAPFNANGSFYVPAGIYEISIQATGAGAAGESETITIPVTPGQTLGVFIGQSSGTGSGRDTWVTRNSSDPNPATSSLIYVNGGGGAGPNGQVNISYSCPDPNDNDCFEIIDDGGISGTTIIRFTCDETWEVPEGLVEFSIFAVGGGGGGGMGPTAGGGGGGGFATTTLTSNAQYGFPAGNSLNIKVGQGGSGASTVNVKGGNGGSSVVTGTIPDPGGNININLSALGGGGGGSFNNLNGADGASGGGGAYSDQVSDTQGLGGAGTPGQGNNGGNGNRGNQPNHARGGAGGGGAGSIGEDGGGAGVGISKSGNGGNGSTFGIDGTPFGYGAGGGGIGFNFNGNPNTPGLGGFANGIKIGGDAKDNGVGNSGTALTGSGGGAGTTRGGNGARGVIYISFFNFQILGVEYQYFNANYNPKNRSGELTWATSKEWENSHFEIERAVNNVKTWTKIGEVNGQGYSDTTVEYNFTDTELPAAGGNIFYRLKQVDMDGDFSYSVTRSIQVNALEGTTAWIAYPNPSDIGSSVTVALLDDSGYTDGTIQIRVSDIRGIFQTYTVQNPEDVSAAVNSYLENARPGMYIVQLFWGDKSEQMKLVRK